MAHRSTQHGDLLGYNQAVPEIPCVALPLDGRAELTADENPWELVARGEAILVRPSTMQGPGTTWRTPLVATSALSRQLQGAAAMLGSDGVSSRLNVVFPPGTGIDDLVPAVGGGFRGLVRGPGGNGITDHVRLVPGVSKGAARAVRGATLGLMAVTVLAEMAAAAEQDRKLTAILSTVERIDARLRLQSDARLRTAEQAIRQAHAALLDRATIPESVGLGAAMSHVQDIRNLSQALLEGWERVVERRAGTGVSGAVLRKELGAVGGVGWDGFVDAVRTAHLAMTLDSRRLVLVAAEAQVHNPEAPLHHLRNAVADDLAERTRDIGRLHSALGTLASTPLTISTWDARVLPHLVADGAAENARTQALFSGLAAAVSAPPVAAPSFGFDAELSAGGDLRILAPDHPAA